MWFDFRNPEFAGVAMADRYQAALEMVDWAERLGFLSVGLFEHHGSDDGYLPSPLVFAAAIAGRTSQIGIAVTMVAPFHDPLLVAEEAAVVDLISGGRLDVTFVNGYVASEFEMFGRSRKDRPALTTEMAKTVRAAWKGEPFEFRGRTVRTTPQPFRPGGPNINLGGSSHAAARRAARLGDSFRASPAPGVWDSYRDECLKIGKPDPGPDPMPTTNYFYLTNDPDGAWEQIAPFALHETNAYGVTMAEAGTGDTGGFKPFESADELRATGQYRVITPKEMIAEAKAGGDFHLLLFHPMMGGLPPALEWESLKLFETEVLPNL
jgi:alkanesulfonate monooxygenase SsuD/methylene tetrahydromethanopterin reductase-like flavin-dependent oxidoreductase (luciferase family)